MPLPTGYSRLVYRGHLAIRIGLDYSEAILSADFGGGFRESENIFPPLRTGTLSYPTLHRDALIEVSTGVFKDRLTYIYDFFRASKDAADKPFLMKSPIDGKWFLWQFTDEELDLELVDLRMATTGLQIKQVYVRGLTPNADGSFTE